MTKNRKIERFQWAPLSEKQIFSIEHSDSRLNIWEGAVRSGKTIASIIRWLIFIKDGPPGNLLMIGKTERTLKRNILDEIEKIVGPKHFKTGNGEVYIYGRTVFIAGANDERAQNKIRGLTLVGAYGDEITLWPHSFFKMLLTRLSDRGAKFFGTTNPDSPYHWFKVHYLDRTDLDLVRFSFTLDDNLSLDPSYIENLKKEFSGLWYDRFIRGLWCLAQGLVYGDDFKEKVHVVPTDQIKEMVERGMFHRYIGGADFGFTHPMAGNIYGLAGDPLNPEYYQIAEFYKTGQKTEALRDFFLEWEELLGEKFFVIFCDSAEPDRILTLKEAGLRAKPADKQINPGINTVQTLFKNNRLFIARHNKHTLGEIQVYRYPSEDDGESLLKKDQPIDENNHAMDAKRYSLHNYEKYLIKLRRKKENKRRLRSNRPSRRSA